MNVKVIAGLISILAMLSTMANAAELKVGYIDIRSAVENTKVYQAGIKRLEGLTEKKKSELDAMEEKLRGAISQLRSQSMMLSPEQIEAKQEDHNEMRKKIERMQQDAEDELLREKRRLDQGVFADFYAKVQSYAKEKGYDLILQKQSALIFGSEALDLTDEISAALDK